MSISSWGMSARASQGIRQFIAKLISMTVSDNRAKTMEHVKTWSMLFNVIASTLVMTVRTNSVEYKLYIHMQIIYTFLGVIHEGSFCEEDLDECEMPRICPVAQVCHNLPGTYACLCPDNSMCGEYCNILNPCYNQTCHNGGECKSVCYDEYNTDWNCECIGNYDGKYCELLTMAQPDRQIDILLIIIPVIAGESQLIIILHVSNYYSPEIDRWQSYICIHAFQKNEYKTMPL